MKWKFQRIDFRFNNIVVDFLTKQSISMSGCQEWASGGYYGFKLYFLKERGPGSTKDGIQNLDLNYS